MSWRLSWYKVDKNEPLRIVNEEDGSEYPEANGEMILWAEGTEVWLDMPEEYKDNTKYFEELVIDEDCDYFEVTKEGLKIFIEKYREIIAKAYKEGFKSDEEREFNWPSLKSYDEEKMREWEHGLVYDLDVEKGNHQFELATSWKYEYTIFNLIAVYKLFDFENYKLIIIGG